MSENELIAEFMGMKRDHLEHEEGTDHDWTNPPKGLHWAFDSPPPFDTVWSWLMPVVEKISKITFKWESKFDSGTDSHYLRTFGMLDEETGRVMVRINNCGLHFGETLIEATYNAVIEFIKWYKSTAEAYRKP